ncbi:MAG: hypothetical protein NTY38_05890, partial [Acidobacteria bacterium]|nr:hypothetical protein [Acidobacteriota bacterium]
MPRIHWNMLAQTQQPAAPAAPKPPDPPPPPMVDSQYGTPAQIMALPAARLIAILKDPGTSVYARAKACQKLAVVGDRHAVPVLAALLTDEHLALYARFGLEPIPDPAAGDALRAALDQVNGRLLVGVINSLGVRRDPQAA